MMRRLTPALIALACLGAGCSYWGYRPGGQQASHDNYCYPSTAEFPQTVVLRDWTTKESLWTVEIPEGQQLVMQFYKDRNKKNDPSRPDLLHWQLMPLGQERGSLTNALPVPDEYHRQVSTFRTGENVAPLSPPVTTGG